MKILGIGESVIDNVIVTQSKNELSHQVLQKHVGGPVPSALILLSRLGLECTLITSLGEDKEADIIKKTLKEEQIQLIPHLQEKTKVHTILVDAKTGQRQKLREESKHRPIKNLNKKLLQEFDLIIMDRHEKTAFKEVLAKKKPQTKLIFDTSTEVSESTLAMLRNATCPIIPIEALVEVDRKNGLAGAMKKLHTICSKPLIITAGELGSILFDGENIEIIPSLSIKAADTTGAGDIYRGAFAFGLLQEWTLFECIQFANLVAGLQCTKIGNVAAIPTKQEIESFKSLVIKKNPVEIHTVNNYFAGLQSI